MIHSVTYKLIKLLYKTQHKILNQIGKYPILKQIYKIRLNVCKLYQKINSKLPYNMAHIDYSKELTKQSPEINCSMIWIHQRSRT